MSNQMEIDEDKLLEVTLKKKGLSHCSNCGRRIDQWDITWNNGRTEGGSPYSVLEIKCRQCDKELAHIDSGIEIDNLEDLCQVIDEDYEGSE